MSTVPIRIGYVGVGRMGLPMVKRLASLGYRVVAYDVVKERVDLAATAGARGRSSDGASAPHHQLSRHEEKR